MCRFCVIQSRAQRRYGRFLSMFTHEIIRYDEKLPVKLLLQKIGSVEMHWHESM